mmetsp:Transcript_49503/g.130355  ORF Transcript_49503/g.130355 Transcript_49503/m.130355 type:complete len:80 (+) Transcript_49503:1018-1257(+)
MVSRTQAPFWQNRIGVMSVCQLAYGLSTTSLSKICCSCEEEEKGFWILNNVWTTDSRQKKMEHSRCKSQQTKQEARLTS